MNGVNGASPMFIAADLMDFHEAEMRETIAAIGPEATAAVLRAMADLIEQDEGFGGVPAGKLN
jgi:hypothetical protein